MAQVPPFASRIRPKTGKNGGRPGSGGIGGMPGGYARPQDNNRRGGRRGRWGRGAGQAWPAMGRHTLSNWAYDERHFFVFSGTILRYRGQIG